MLTKLAKALDRLFDTSEGDPMVCSGRSFTVTVRCDQCGETLSVRVDRDHELQTVHAEDAEEGDQPLEYVLRKELVGGDCQNLIRFTLRFDCDHGLLESHIDGGEFVEKRQRQRAALRETAELST